jgi:hypothetical protein
MSHESPYIDSSQYRLAYLYASPLIEPRTGSEIEILDTQKEIEILRQCLRESNRRIYFKVDVATPQNLRSIATIGAVMIHYSGHGIPGELVFEDGRGGIHHVDVDLLKPFFSAGGVQTKLVFVGTCHSEAAGRKFVEAGVPHVIAVSNRVADISSRIFAQHLYFALFGGKKTVREAFDIACNMIMVLEGGRPTDTKKFILLPESGDHDVVIFQNAPKGKYIDETDPLAPNGCDRPPKYFVGRKHAVYEIYFRLGANCNRWVTIRGERGIGKTSLALRAVQYMNERKLFDVIYFVPLNKIGASPLDDHNTLATLMAQCMYNAGEGVISTEDLIDELTGARAEMNMKSAHGENDRRTAMSPAADRGRKFPSHICSWMRILFVIDAADDFVSASGEGEATAVTGDGSLEKRAETQSASDRPDEVGAVSYGPEDTTRKQTGQGLITLLGEILRRTENVKLLITSRQRLVGGHMVWQVNEPEKVVSVERLSNRLSADLLVRLAPRGLKPSEVMSDNALTALDTLAARPVVRDLGGHPRAIARFALLLADRMLDDSEEMRSTAREMLKKAQEWRDADLIPAPPAGGMTPGGSSSSGRDSSGKGTTTNVEIPVAVAFAAPLTPQRQPHVHVPATAAVIMAPGRVARAVTDNSIRSRDGAVPGAAHKLGARCSSSVDLTESMSQSAPLVVVQPHMRPSVSAGMLSQQDSRSSKDGQSSSRGTGSRGRFPHSHSQPFLRSGQASRTSSGLRGGDEGRVSSDVNMEEARRVARAVIHDAACADVWARVSAASTAGGNIFAPPHTSVRWSVLITALSESIKAETKVVLDRRQDATGPWSTMSTEDDNLINTSMSRRLTREDATFLGSRIKIDEAQSVPGRGRTDGTPTTDYMITRARFIVFCEDWWAPLLKTLRHLDAEFSCTDPVIIHGFLTRQAAVNKLMATNAVGVFLLRFSESQKGLIVVSFTDIVPSINPDRYVTPVQMTPVRPHLYICVLVS